MHILQLRWQNFSKTSTGISYQHWTIMKPGTLINAFGPFNGSHCLLFRALTYYSYLTRTSVTRKWWQPYSRSTWKCNVSRLNSGPIYAIPTKGIMWARKNSAYQSIGQFKPSIYILKESIPLCSPAKLRYDGFQNHPSTTAYLCVGKCASANSILMSGTKTRFLIDKQHPFSPTSTWRNHCPS